MKTALSNWGRPAALAGAVASMIALSAWHSATAQQPGAGGPLKIGVVDLGRVGDGLQEAAEVNDHLKAAREDAQHRLDEVANQLTSANKELEMITNKSSPEFWQKLGQAQELEVQARARKQALERNFDLQKGMVTADIYTKMMDSVSELAKQEGFDLILVDDRMVVPPKDKGAEAAGQAIQARKLLFASPRADVTDSLITLMNNKYKAAPKGSGTPPLPAPGGTGAKGAGH